MLKPFLIATFAAVAMLSGCGGGSDSDESVSITLDQKSYEINTAVTRSVAISGTVTGLKPDSSGKLPMIGYYWTISPQVSGMTTDVQPLFNSSGRFSFTIGVSNELGAYPVGTYTVTPFFNLNNERISAPTTLTVK